MSDQPVTFNSMESSFFPASATPSTSDSEEAKRGVSLAPLEFEDAMKGLLATPPEPH